MASTAGFLVFLSLAYWTWAVVDIFTAENAEVRLANEPTWLVIITVVPVFGPLAWCLVGRPKHTAISPSAISPSTTPLSGRPHAEADAPPSDVGRPLGPEDDEAWMANLTVSANGAASIDALPGDSLVLEAADDFAAWEADL